MNRRRLSGLFFLFLPMLSPAAPLSPSSPSAEKLSVSPEGGSAGAPGMPALSSAGLRKLASQADEELRKDILPYWLRLTRDHQRGGFFGEISNDSVIKKDAVRGALLTSRVLWTFSAAFRKYGDLEYKEMAQWAYKDLIARFFDQRYGGFYWSITADGKPVDQRKHIYGQAFALYGLSEYYRAVGEPVALEQATALYLLIEEHARDPEHGGYYEAFTREWTLDPALQRGIVGSDAPKSQNTHLHIMEAYANLLHARPNAEVRTRTRELVELMMAKILSSDHRHLQLFFNAEWKPVSDGISYGHDIEASWLLVEAAEAVGDPSLLERVKPISLTIARACAAEGVDADGGIFNEGGPHGLVDRSKDWWPQAEAAIGFLNAYQLSGDAKYFEASAKSWSFIQAKFLDREHGEWFEALSADGTVARQKPKVRLWKCPYHNGRCCLELIERLEKKAVELDQVRTTP